MKKIRKSKKYLGILLVLSFFMSIIDVSSETIGITGNEFEVVETKVLSDEDVPKITETGTNEQVTAPESKISSELLEIMEKCEIDDKILVSIWTTDIDQSDVDKAVERRTGFNRDNIDVIKDYASDELAVRMMALSENSDVVDKTLERDFNAYLESTAEAREIEKSRTDEFVSTRRDVSREKYNASNDNFVSLMQISDEDIIFKSQYSPMIIAKLTVEEIHKISKSHETVNIWKHEEEEMVECSGSTLTMDAKASVAKSQLGIDGSGVSVGVWEAGTPFGGSLLDSNYDETELLPNSRIIELPPGRSSTTYSSHIFFVTKIIAGRNSGVAPGATVIISYGSTSAYKEMEDLITAGASIINASTGTNVNSSISEDKNTIWHNHIVSMHNVTLIKSAGNDASKYMDNFSIADNVITANATHPNSSYSLGNDYGLYDFTFQQGANNCHKPDIASHGGSTSEAAAFTSGTVALLMQLRPALKAQPHAVKAILNASCHTKAAVPSGAVNETMTSNPNSALTNRQGAGVLNPYIAVAIASNNSYGTGTITNVNDVKNHSLTLGKFSSTGLNVSLSWLRETEAPNGHTPDQVNSLSAQMRQDLNLELSLGGIPVKESLLGISSTEAVYFNNTNSYWSNWDVTPYFNIKIKKHSGSNVSTRYAYAWSVNNEVVQPPISSITIKGVQYSTNLTYLNLSNLGLTNADIQPLKYMTKLSYLDLNGNQISDITPLNGLMKLDVVGLKNNLISNIAPLDGLSSISSLDLSGNDINDISPLSEMIRMRWLDLSGNDINNISPLTKMTNLEVLSLKNNLVGNISFLGGLNKLTSIDLSDNSGINNVTALHQKFSLTWLNLIGASLSVSQVNALKSTISSNCNVYF